MWCSSSEEKKLKNAKTKFTFWAIVKIFVLQKIKLF